MPWYWNATAGSSNARIGQYNIHDISGQIVRDPAAGSLSGVFIYLHSSYSKQIVRMSF